MEVQRSDDAFFPGFGQVYVTQSLNGVVKAW
jgi:dTDP-4-dehydrorhamnose 3,5-epimerase